MNSNFSIRFHIVRENSTSMPSIFDRNTTIEISSSPIIVNESQHNVFVSQPDIPSFFMNNIFDTFNNNFTDSPFFEASNDDSIMNMFMNQSLQNDQTQTEKATVEMIRDLGPYRRIRENDNLLGDKCVICTEEYLKDEGVRELNCKHVYHKKCIDRWLKEGSVCCPICRLNPFKVSPES